MPVCFEVRINGGPLTITGQADISVLSACLTFVSARSELEFRAGGLVSNAPHDNEHIDWLRQDLKIGDEVSIRIVDSDSVSVPLRRERQDPAASEREERAYYERLKRKYESNSSVSEG